MNTKRKIDLLDVSLRDGSYTIGYQFSILDNITIAAGLERAGVKYIEIGHGTGLGSYRKDNNYQAHSDKDYMLATSEALKTSEFGFFFIPGIGNANDLRLLKDNGGSFFRIGTGIENFQSALKFIRLAKKLELKYWINLMKSYVYSYKEFAEFTRTTFLEGAEGIYLVDSAGGMMPKDVGNYIQEAKEILDKEKAENFSLGFHGHENLSLGVACSLSAVENGANIVDGSLLGIGRSIGNSPIETLAMALKKSDFIVDIDPWQLSDLAERTVRPYLENRWRHSSIEQALGYKEIHSGFLETITNYAKKKKLNLRELILSLPDEARRDVSGKSLAIAAKEIDLTPANRRRNINVKFSTVKELQISSSINDYIENLISQGEKTNRKTVLIFTSNWIKSSGIDYTLQKIKTIENNEVGTIEMNINSKKLNFSSNNLKRINYLMFDNELSRNTKFMQQVSSFPKQKVFSYPDKNSIFSHVARYISVMSRNMRFKPIISSVVSDQNDELLLRTLINGYGVQYTSDTQRANVHILISKNNSNYPIEEYKNLKYIIDLRSKILTKENISYCFKNNIELLALDCEAAVISEVLANMASDKSINVAYGSRNISGIRLVAKGKWGKIGDIVVDKIKNPSLIIGVSDGLGSIKKVHSSTDKKNIKKIINFIINQ